ncbi:MAG: hypothetical protein GEV08_05280 [Acidimicrobiia bacterium]|nr:hypothetical protein [Acidimicrobiia bacterium]
MARRALALTCVLVAGAGLGACGDDGPSAQERACEARTELRTSIDDAGDDVNAANLGEARDSLDDVGEDIDELTGAMGDLAEGQAEEVQPLVDDLRATVDRLRATDELESVGEGLADARETVGALVDQLGATLQC